MTDVTVVTVTYQATQAFQRCLSLLWQYRRVNFDGKLTVIIVDNSPADHPTRKFVLHAKKVFDAIHDSHFEMKLIIPEENIGFGQGNNRAMAMAKDPYVILLNPDVFVPPGWIRPMISCAVKTGAGIVGTRILDTERRVVHEGIMFKPEGEPYDGVITPWPYGQPVAYEAQAVTAACMLLQRPVYQSIEFDPIYGLGYYEDVDYAFRARSEGWQVWWTPTPEVVHAKHSSWNEVDRPKLNSLCAKNLGIFLDRWKEKIVPSDQWLWEKIGNVDTAMPEEPGLTDRVLQALAKAPKE